MEVSTTRGMQQVAMGDSQDPAPATAVVDHCPLCVLWLDRLAAPVEPFVWQELPQAQPVFDLAQTPLPLTPRHWAVQSRAPAVLS